jgi:3-oxoacyl-[acyl-carrier-protein] synthase-1
VTAVAIKAIGAFTPVGRSAPETMGSLICRVQLFDDLDVLGPDGEPITGAMTPIPRRISGLERLMALAFYAIEECAATISPDRAVPLVLAAPESSELGEGGAEALLTRLSAEPSLRIDASASQVLAQGRDGVSLALERARQIVLTREAPACLVAGVDSFVRPERVKRLLEKGRVRCGPNLDGFRPGEAAACLLLSPARASGGGALLVGLGPMPIS